MINFGTAKVVLSKKFLSKLKQLDKFLIDQEFANKVGKVVLEGSLQAISHGISPVRGVGRFVPYKDPLNYPGDLKPSRPVNLSLTGDMLKSLNFRKKGNFVEFGIFEEEVSDDIWKRTLTHNKGTHKHVPRRQFIPQRGEEFIVSIQSVIRKLYAKRISELLHKFSKNF